MKEISKKPMVDILSELTGEQVVMDGDTYVAAKDGTRIGEDLIASAKTEQEALYNDAVKQRKMAEARAYLASTDWYVVRLTETGVAIPEDVLAKRAEARAML